MLHNVLPSTLYTMSHMHLQSLKLICSTVKEEMRYCPPHHMTYAPAIFEVAPSNSLGEDAFTRMTLFDL